jgi:hypothetical protein
MLIGRKRTQAMTEPAPKVRSAMPVPALPFLVGSAVYLLLFTLGGRLLNDPDVYWHQAVGQWIVDNGVFPTADPLSHTMRGAHWIAFEWLSQFAYAAAYDLGGWSGVVVLAAAAAGLAFGLLTHFLLRELPPAPALTLVIAALVLVSPHLLARPHVLALPMMVAWIGPLVRAVDRGRQPPFVLLPLMALWANLHGSFTIGLALLAPIAFEAVLRTQPAERRSVALRWAAFVALAVLAACITPYGPDAFLVTIRHLDLGEALSIIVEWQPQDFGRLGAFEICVLAGIGYALFRGITLPWVRIVVLLGLLHLSLAHVRHADVLAMLGPLFLAAPLSQYFTPRRKADSAETLAVPLPNALSAAALSGLLLSITLGVNSSRAMAPNSQNSPAAAVTAGNLLDGRPVLNEFAFGGYLTYVGVAPFIDGRAELYGRAFLMRHHRAIMLQDLPDFLRLLDEYNIAATLLAPTTPAVALLDRLPGWRRVHGDNIAVVHRRVIEKPSP